MNTRSFIARSIKEDLTRHIAILEEFKSALANYDCQNDPGLLDLIKNMDGQFERTIDRMEDVFIEELSTGIIKKAEAKEIFTSLRQERQLMIDIMEIYQHELKAHRSRLIEGIRLLEDIESDFIKAA